jgi:tRNA A37 threonylcarbamoyladenosine synthetase subunit TsaC/SUA5/YrdC
VGRFDFSVSRTALLRGRADQPVLRSSTAEGGQISPTESVVGIIGEPFSPTAAAKLAETVKQSAKKILQIV